MKKHKRKVKDLAEAFDPTPERYEGCLKFAHQVIAGKERLDFRHLDRIQKRWNLPNTEVLLLRIENSPGDHGRMLIEEILSREDDPVQIAFVEVLSKLAHAAFLQLLHDAHSPSVEVH